MDLSARPPPNSRICSPHGPLLSWPRGGHEQRVSSMALGAKTEVASAIRWTYGFLFLQVLIQTTDSHDRPPTTDLLPRQRQTQRQLLKGRRQLRSRSQPRPADQS